MPMVNSVLKGLNDSVNALICLVNLMTLCMLAVDITCLSGLGVLVQSLKLSASVRGKSKIAGSSRALTFRFQRNKMFPPRLGSLRD